MATKYERYPTVSISKTVSVYPKIIHPQKVLNLSNLDRQCPTLMYLVFFYDNPNLLSCDGYKSCNDLSLNSVFNSLKSGLEETLSMWYPAAGRLSLNPNDGKLNLWCNNKGAVLVEATSQVKISDLGDLTQYNEFYEKLVFKPDFDGNDFPRMPLVVGQVTKFGCGGYSIGIGTSHSLFDGPSAYSFLSAWASNSAINTKQTSHDHHQLLITPVHDRATLLTLGNYNSQSGVNNSLLISKIDHVITAANNSNRNNQYDVPQMKARGSVGAAAIDHLLQLLIQASTNGGNIASSSNIFNQKYCSFVFKTFHLSSSLIENLKREVFKDGGFSCSSFEVLAALLWKARTKAMGLRKEAMVCLQFAVDTRNKVAPPLPAGFSGNAYVLASVALAAGELERIRHKAIVEKIRQAKDSVNNDYVKSYMEGVQGPRQASLPPLRELTLVSDWTRMPFHNINFFSSRATHVSPLVPPIPQIAYFMQNPNDDRAVDVRIGLLPDNLDAFCSYFLAAIAQ
ncbi:Transferase [Parasponia andersonii]|uniref:Transferase n=1 Tax=Parasponia andersonii TaxID=3476 RepID=A0A2P5ANG7_PARAD|nr:Transferase [Parasponia andersonii]